jgi:hypothetical protein
MTSRSAKPEQKGNTATFLTLRVPLSCSIKLLVLNESVQMADLMEYNMEPFRSLSELVPYFIPVNTFRQIYTCKYPGISSVGLGSHPLSKVAEFTPEQFKCDSIISQVRTY